MGRKEKIQRGACGLPVDEDVVEVSLQPLCKVVKRVSEIFPFDV